MVIITFLGKRIELMLRAYRRGINNRLDSNALTRQEFKKNWLIKKKMKQRIKYRNRNRYGNNEI